MSNSKLMINMKAICRFSKELIIVIAVKCTIRSVGSTVTDVIKFEE